MFVFVNGLEKISGWEYKKNIFFKISICSVKRILYHIKKPSAKKARPSSSKNGKSAYITRNVSPLYPGAAITYPNILYYREPTDIGAIDLL